MARFGLHTLTITPDWRPERADQILPPVTAQGISVLEVLLLDPDRFDAAGTRAALERHGMGMVASLGLPGRLDVTRDTEEAGDLLAGVLRTAREAGAEAVSGVIYGTIGKTTGAPPTARETDAICRLLDTAAATARGLGLRLGIEACNRYETHLLNTAAQGVELIERVGAENLFLHLDSYHMNIEEAGMAEGIAEAGEHLGYFHLSESNRGVPGRGTVDWDATFRGLADIGYDGILTMESFLHMTPELAAGLAIWRPVAGRPEDVLEVGMPFLTEKAEAAGLTVER